VKLIYDDIKAGILCMILEMDLDTYSYPCNILPFSVCSQRN
jgi:hypothetical protein